MKKLFLVLVCAVLFSATFVLSSYKTNDNNVPTEELTAMSDDCDEYTYIGTYLGRSESGRKINFDIFQKEGMCNSYYWAIDFNPDGNDYCRHIEHNSTRGVLMKDSEGHWYAAYNSLKYYVDL
ncbi:MAG: hypothetical protein E7067_04660 [Lentimicrobiaceae bacterium]|nr:hypothetical protein [Lentimicrobiaceae bacterium]